MATMLLSPDVSAGQGKVLQMESAPHPVTRPSAQAGMDERNNAKKRTRETKQNRSESFVFIGFDQTVLMATC